MNSDQRIEKIEQFLHTQRYLHGLRFRILEESEDHFVIEFQRASKRALISLNRTLQQNLMTHIHARAAEILEFDPPKKKK